MTFKEIPSRDISSKIRVRVRDVSRRLIHEAKIGEVVWLALDLLILV
jgi:hypothetical protein